MRCHSAATSIVGCFIDHRVEVSWRSRTNRMRSMKPLAERSPLASSERMRFCIVPITDTNGRLIKIELRELLRSDMVGFALNTDSQNCSSEPLL